MYAVIGAVTALIPFGFAFTALGRADRYLPEGGEGTAAVESDAALVVQD